MVQREGELAGEALPEPIQGCLLPELCSKAAKSFVGQYDGEPGSCCLCGLHTPWDTAGTLVPSYGRGLHTGSILAPACVHVIGVHRLCAALLFKPLC